MKLVLTKGAARQLDDLLGYIKQRSPVSGRAVQKRVQTLMNLLLDYSEPGQPTTRHPVRRLVVNPYPYAIFYQVSGDRIVILRVRHVAPKPVK